MYAVNLENVIGKQHAIQGYPNWGKNNTVRVGVRGGVWGSNTSGMSGNSFKLSIHYCNCSNIWHWEGGRNPAWFYVVVFLHLHIV